MKILAYLLIGSLCVSLLVPAEGAFIRAVGRWFRKAGETVVKVVKDNAKEICKIGTKVACPTAVALTATSAIALTAGSAAPAAIAGGAAGVTGCYIASTQCKRGAPPPGIVYYPISDDWDEYDQNNDNVIDYEEFAFDFLARFKFAKPNELRGVFNKADTNGDGKINKKEFAKAPWVKARYKYKVHRQSMN